MKNFETLVSHIHETHSYFHDYAARQVNNAFTLRNWLVGMHLFEYEQNGSDRAAYGERLYKNLAARLKEKEVKGMSFTFLHTCKQFYITYPQIVQTLSEQLPLLENSLLNIVQMPSEQLISMQKNNDSLTISVQNPKLFLSRISFSHIVEFVKIDEPLKRSFYEMQTIKNNWTVKQLQREVNNNQKAPGNSFYCGAFLRGLSAIALNVGTSFIVGLPPYCHLCRDTKCYI